MAHVRLLALLALTLAACDSDKGLTTYNNEPEVTITSPGEGEEVEEGEMLTLTGQADDPDDPSEELVATWSTGGRDLCEGVAVESDGSTSCSVELTEEDDEITLVVADPDGATGTDHVSITVVPTGSPHVELTAPETTGVYYSDKLVGFEGTVEDEEDEPTELVVGIESSVDGELGLDVEVSSEGLVSAFGLLSEGEHALKLWAEDSSGKRGSDSVVIQVGPPNSDPTCAITAPETGSVVELGSLLVFEGEVDYPDIPENDLSVTWTSDRDGLLGASTPSSAGAVAFPWSTLSANTHVLTLEVSDEVGGSCTDFILLTVGSSPSISLTAPTYGEVVDEGEDLVFEADVSDVEDAATALSLSWESDVDGVFSTRGADSTGHVALTVDDLSVGDHAITVRVSDTHGMSAVAAVDITVNGAPSAPVVSLSPDPADTSDDLGVSMDAAAVDPEGDSLSYSYAWYLDGILSSASTSSSLSSAHTDTGSAVTSSTLTVLNTPPEAPVVSISLSTPIEGADDLVCSVSTASTDADGDSITSTAWRSPQPGAANTS